MDGGEANADDERFRATLDAQGAVVMGRRMFSGGSGPWEDDPNAGGWWGDDPPFRAPVFVVTHHERDRVDKGVTSYNFVTGGIESAVAEAREAAGSRNVHVAGGAETIDEALKAGLVDELELHVAPVLLGSGTRLFADLGAGDVRFERVDVASSPLATHVRYRVLPG
jgi:dihydrofolate reductase